MTTLETWHDTCAACGKNLPLDAPPHRKFCDQDCRRLAYARQQHERHQRLYAARKAARLAAKHDRPCEREGCGGVILASAPANKRFCSSVCCEIAYRARPSRAEYMRAWRKKRAQRKGG